MITFKKIATGQGDDYSTGCFLNYSSFKKYYNIIAIGSSKQQVLDADPKATQQINLTENLQREPNVNTAVFSIVEEAKETTLDFSQETVRVL